MKFIDRRKTKQNSTHNYYTSDKHILKCMYNVYNVSYTWISDLIYSRRRELETRPSSGEEILDNMKQREEKRRRSKRR